MRNLDELFSYVEQTIRGSSKIRMGSDVRDTMMVSGSEVLRILDSIFSNIKFLVENKTVDFTDGLDEQEWKRLFIVPGLRNKELQDAVAAIIISRADDIDGLVQEFKDKKRELETRLAEDEIGEMDTEEFNLFYPENPYAQELPPEDKDPRHEVIKKRWDRGGKRQK